MRQISYAQALVEAHARGDDPRRARLHLRRGRRPVRRRLRRHPRPVRGIRREARASTPPSRRPPSAARRSARPWPGMRPVAEIMYVDFTPLAMDQIANQGAKNRYMFGGQDQRARWSSAPRAAPGGPSPPTTRRAWNRCGRTSPGIYVVMPSTPYDAKGLLKAAIRDDNPVMFIEHKMLYKEKGPVPEEEYIIPLGVADIKRAGKDVTLVTYSRMVLRALEAAEMLAKEGIDVEVDRPAHPQAAGHRHDRHLGQEDRPVRRRDRGLRKHQLHQRGDGRRSTSWPSTGWTRRWCGWRRPTCPVPRAEDPGRPGHPQREPDRGGLPKGGELMAEELFIPKLGQTVEEVTLIELAGRGRREGGLWHSRSWRSRRTRRSSRSKPTPAATCTSGPTSPGQPCRS